MKPIGIIILLVITGLMGFTAIAGSAATLVPAVGEEFYYDVYHDGKKVGTASFKIDSRVDYNGEASIRLIGNLNTTVTLRVDIPVSTDLTFEQYSRENDLLWLYGKFNRKSTVRDWVQEEEFSMAHDPIENTLTITKMKPIKQTQEIQLNYENILFEGMFTPLRLRRTQLFVGYKEQLNIVLENSSVKPAMLIVENQHGVDFAGQTWNSYVVALNGETHWISTDVMRLPIRIEKTAEGISFGMQLVGYKDWEGNVFGQIPDGIDLYLVTIAILAILTIMGAIYLLRKKKVW